MTEAFHDIQWVSVFVLKMITVYVILYKNLFNNSYIIPTCSLFRIVITYLYIVQLGHFLGISP